VVFERPEPVGGVLLPRMRKRLMQLSAARRLAKALSRNLWQAQAFLVLAALQIIPRHLPRQFAWIRISLPSGAERRFWLEDFTQARALSEVLAEHDYDVAIEGQVQTIVDLGANAGQAAVYFRDRFPDASILAVEADPDTARLAERNTAADPRTVVVAAAVTDHDGSVTLTRLEGHSWGSNVFSAWSRPDTPQVEVRSVTLRTLLREHGLAHVDVLKVDVEGAEMIALTADSTLDRVDTVLGELHPSILQMPVADALGALQRHGGFKRAWLHREFIFGLARSSEPPSAAGVAGSVPAPARDEDGGR
jgi:FkbM family methyltransferase